MMQVFRLRVRGIGSKCVAMGKKDKRKKDKKEQREYLGNIQHILIYILLEDC
jgi:hypothetical protein